MSTVSYIQDDSLKYPDFPYSPDRKYPELSVVGTDKSNRLYAKMRQLLRDYRLDDKNFGKKNWNPLSVYIQPGQKVVLKPNWVMHRNLKYDNFECLVTHTSVIRFVMDYVLIALKGKGEIIIADAPLQACDFEQLVQKTRINDLLKIYRSDFPKVALSVIDLRKTLFSDNRQHSSPGDVSAGYTLVDLGRNSLLEDISEQSSKFRVTMYDPRLLFKHHSPGKHEYLISNTLLTADCIINLPKMKTHLKAGLTGAMKNLVGINGHKEYLPHHRYGSISEGGDQYPVSSLLLTVFNWLSDVYWMEGKNHWTGFISRLALKFLSFLAKLTNTDGFLDAGWPGNDTIPRTIVDLNNILITRRKKIIHLIDGVIAGEGQGPLKPEHKHAGVIIFSDLASAADFVMARLIGYQPQRLNTINHALNHPKSHLKFHPNDLLITQNGHRVDEEKISGLNFKKPPLWQST